MSTEVFLQILTDRDESLLSQRLDELERLGFNADERIGLNGELLLPLSHVSMTIHRNRGRFGDYFGQVLLFVTSKTTPTREIIEYFALYGSNCYHALEELLTRYEGEKVSYLPNHQEYQDVLLGYSAVDLVSLVPYFLKRGEHAVRQTVHILPIETVILQYAASPSLSFEQALNDLSKYHEGPRPSLERLVGIISNGEGLFTYLDGIVPKEWSIERVRELVEKVK